MPLEEEFTGPAKPGEHFRSTGPDFPFIASPFAAYTSLRFAGVARRTPTRPSSVRATQSGVTDTALSHSRNSATLRWLGQEGSLGAERFASTVGRSLPRG